MFQLDFKQSFKAKYFLTLTSIYILYVLCLFLITQNCFLFIKFNTTISWGMTLRTIRHTALIYEKYVPSWNCSTICRMPLARDNQ